MRNKVFWIEGLPGTGKTTIISRLKARHKGLIVFPKTDVVSIFAKGLNFDFRAISKPSWDSAWAVEMLKCSILNGISSTDDVVVVGERSYLSSLVYYAICSHEHITDRFAVEGLKRKFKEIERHYDETVILLEGDPKVCLGRDAESYSNFWHVREHAVGAGTLYREMAVEMGVKCHVVSAEDSLSHIMAEVEAIINA